MKAFHFFFKIHIKIHFINYLQIKKNKHINIIYNSMNYFLSEYCVNKGKDVFLFFVLAWLL